MKSCGQYRRISSVHFHENLPGDLWPSDEWLVKPMGELEGWSVHKKKDRSRRATLATARFEPSDRQEGREAAR